MMWRSTFLVTQGAAVQARSLTTDANVYRANSNMGTKQSSGQVPTLLTMTKGQCIQSCGYLQIKDMVNRVAHGSCQPKGVSGRY